MIEIILLFLVLVLVLGYSFARFFTKNLYETIALSLVLGLAALPIVLFVLRVLHIPITYFFVLLPGLGYISYDILKKRTFEFSFNPSLILIFVVVALFTWFMYVGAMQYPYLENDDPWNHAAGAHYVALEQSVVQPTPFTRYLEPYPPYYTAMMGVLHSFSSDLQFILKFVNALIIGLSAVAAFYVFRSYFDEYSALGGAIILAAIPGYMSHFIWSQTLAIPVFLITLWALNELRLNPSREKMIVTALLVFSSTIIQQSTAVIFALLFVIFGVLTLVREKKLSQVQYSIVGGGILSFFHWLFLLIVHGYERFFSVVVSSSSIFTADNADTSGGVIYSLSNFLFPAMSSKIDQATGIGWLVILLVVFAVFVSLKHHKKLAKNVPLQFSLVFLVISILGTMGNAFPVKLFPHRFWVFLAIACALLVVAALHFVTVKKKHLVRIGVIALIVVLVLATLLPARFAVQHATWPPGVGWTSGEQLAGYISLKELEPTKIFTLCGLPSYVIGFNQLATPWDPDEKIFRESDWTAQSVHDFLSEKGYQLLIIDTACEQEKVQTLVTDMGTSGLFRLEQQSPGFLLLKR